MICWNKELDTWEYIPPTPEQQLAEWERLRSRTRHNEASALGKARRDARREIAEKWQAIIAAKDAEIAKLKAEATDLLIKKLFRLLTHLQANKNKTT